MAYTFLKSDLGDIRAQQFRDFADSLDAQDTTMAPMADGSTDLVAPDRQSASPDLVAPDRQSAAAPAAAPDLSAPAGSDTAPPVPPAAYTPPTSPVSGAVNTQAAQAGLPGLAQQPATTSDAPPASTMAPPSGGTSVPDVPDWLAALIQKHAPPQLKNDPQFIATVAAGSKAESGWDPNRIQVGFRLGDGAGARGLFQFDMGGMGAPYRGNESALLGPQGAQLQASQIVPLYAQAYQNAPAGLSPAERASWVAAQAERPKDYQDPNSPARRNYAAAFNQIMAGGPITGGTAPSTSGLSLPVPSTSGSSSTPASPADTSASATAQQPSSPVDQFRTFADSLHQGADQAVSAVGQAKDSALDQFRRFADSLHANDTSPSAQLAGAGLQSATGEPASISQPQVDAARSSIPSSPDQLPFAGRTAADAITGPLSAAYNSPLRQELAPNITEPGHPFGELADIQDKRNSGQPVSTQELGHAALAIGGVEGAADTAASKLVDAAGAHGLTINLPKFAPPEVRQVIQQAYDSAPEVMDAARRGVVPDDVVRQLADQAGTTVNRIVGIWKPGQAKNAETILALRQSLADQSQQVLDAQSRLQANPSDVQALSDLTQALTRHRAVQEVVTGVTAEAGRALRQFQQPVTGQQAVLGQLQKMAAAAKMSPDEFAGHVANADLSDPSAVANLARTLTQHSFGDKLTALWYFNLLSSPVTHIRNTVSNAIVLASRPVESSVSSAIDLGRVGVGKALGQDVQRERFFGEVPAQVVGMTAGLQDGVRQAYQVLRNGFTDTQVAREPELAASEPFTGRLADLTVNVPGRALKASDVFFRTLNQTASLYGQAYRTASQEGLKGQELLDRASELVHSPTPEMLGQAEKDGAYYVFQQPSDFASSLAQFRGRFPAVRYLIPFVQTPYNVAKYALERTPLALGKLAQEGVTGDLATKGAGDFSDRLARIAIGSATMVALVQQAQAGNLTGPAPKDPTEKDAFYRQGKQPYSFKVGDSWQSYQALQPFSTLFAAAAAAADLRRKGQTPDALTGTAVGAFAIARGLLDQPWTQGLSDALDFISGADIQHPQDTIDAAGKYAARQSSSLIPSVVRWLARATDSTVREPGAGFAGVGDNLKASIPGLSGSVPARLDAFGNAQQRPTSGLATLNPFNPSSINKDPVEQELARLQVKGFQAEPGLVGRQITVAHTPVDLRPEQQRQYQLLAGSLSYTLLDSVIGTPEYEKLTDAQKTKLIGEVVDRTRTFVRTQMQPQLLDQAVDARVQQIKQRAATP